MYQRNHTLANQLSWRIFKTNWRKWTRTPEVNIVNVVNGPIGLKFDGIVVAMIEVQEGEDLIAATECQGLLIAEGIKKHTTPFKKGNIELSKTICGFAYIENGKPKYMNVVIGNNNASRIIAQIYQSYIEDETFWESAEDIIATYFNDTITH